MSAQAGILYADSRPVPQGTIDLLCRLNAERGPDGTRLHVSDGLAMLSFAFHFDDLSEHEQQPVRAADGTHLTWDGRLDNRDDFLVSLSGAGRADHTDAALMAEGLAAWGFRALERAIGDWSLAHVDPVRRELCLASDYAGNRPVYYCCRPTFVAWSTCLETLAPVCGVEGQVSDTFMALLLTQQSFRELTPYPDIVQVPAGTALLLTPGSSPRRHEIAPLIASELRHRRTHDYEDQYRHLLTEAVRVRLRTNTTVWTELSGGYDSSSVTCVAASLIEGGAVQAKKLQPVSHVYPQSPESDESVYIGHVEDACRVRSLRVPRTAVATLKPTPSPWLLQTAADGESSATDVAAAHGCRVLLTGELGDLISVGTRSEDALLDHLSHGRLTSFLADSLAHCRASQQRIWPTWFGVAKCLVSSPSDRMTVQTLAALWAERRRTPADDLTQTFGLSARLASLADADSGAVPASHACPRGRRSFVSGMTTVIASGVLAAYRTVPALCVSHPFAHRPLVDFILSSPPSVLWRPHHPRAYVCEALADVLPRQILMRGHKGYFQPALTRRLAPAAMDGIDSVDTWRLTQRGYVSPQIIRDILRAFLDGSQSTASLLYTLFAAEAIIGQIERASASNALRSAHASDPSTVSAVVQAR